MLSRLNSLMIICLLLFSSQAGALSSTDGKMLINGFVSQGYIRSTGNNFLGNSKQGSFDLSQGGLNIFYTPRDWLSFAALLTHRNYGDYKYNQENVELDYLKATIDLFQTAEFSTSLTIGRFYVPFGFQNEARDNPFAHSGILLNQAMYSEFLRTRTVNGDGARLFARYLGNSGEIYFDWARGVPNRKFKEFTINNSGGFFPGEVDHDVNDVFRVTYESPNGHFKTAITIGEFFHTGTAYQGPVRIEIEEPFEYHGISAKYDFSTWSVSGEFFEIDYDARLSQYLDATDTLLAVTPQNVLANGWYLQLTWRPDFNYELFVRYDHFDPFSKDPNNLKAAAPESRHKQNQLVLGAERFFGENWIIKSEFHLIDGAFFAHWSENDLTQLEEDWTLFVVQLSYRF